MGHPLNFTQILIFEKFLHSDKCRQTKSPSVKKFPGFMRNSSHFTLGDPFYLSLPYIRKVWNRKRRKCMRKNEMYRRMKQNKKHAPTSYQRNAQIKVPKNVFDCFLNFLVLRIITFLTSLLTISLTRQSFYLLSRSRRIPGCYVTVMCHCIRPDFLDIFSKPRPIPVYLVLRYSLLRLLRDFFFNC